MNYVIKWTPKIPIEKVFDKIAVPAPREKWLKSARYITKSFYKKTRPFYLYCYDEENWGSWVRWDHTHDKSFQGIYIDMLSPLEGRT